MLKKWHVSVLQRKNHLKLIIDQFKHYYLRFTHERRFKSVFNLKTSIYLCHAGHALE